MYITIQRSRIKKCTKLYGNFSTFVCYVTVTEFLKYKVDRPGIPSSGSSLAGLSMGTPGSTGPATGDEPISGMLWVHLLAGRGLRPSSGTSAATTPVTPSGGAPQIGSKILV